jgi:HSP20 family molecular chaperone IbpA
MPIPGSTGTRRAAAAVWFALSAKVKQERIGAQSEDGVLTLTLTKAAEARPHRITIP